MEFKLSGRIAIRPDYDAISFPLENYSPSPPQFQQIARAIFSRTFSNSPQLFVPPDRLNSRRLSLLDHSIGNSRITLDSGCRFC